jgi:hypothetical protein
MRRREKIRKTGIMIPDGVVDPSYTSTRFAGLGRRGLGPCFPPRGLCLWLYWLRRFDHTARRWIHSFMERSKNPEPNKDRRRNLNFMAFSCRSAPHRQFDDDDPKIYAREVGGCDGRHEDRLGDL